MSMRVVAGLLAAAFFAAALSGQPAATPQRSPSASASASAPASAPASVAASATPAAPPAYTLSPEKRDKAIAYSRARYGLHFAAFFWSLLVLVVIVALRLGPRFRDGAEAVSRRRFWQAAVFVPLLFVTQGLLELPTAAYGHHLERLYDQSVQGWGSWLGDQAKALLVGLVIAIPLVWLLYAILRKSPRRWWLWFWLATLPILVFLIFVSPVLIDPLFFRFEPLAPGHPDLAHAIERVTVRAGEHIPLDRMFAMNASTKYNSINAYVTGLGASKRVVVWDTTIAKATIPQTLLVFGHEMGHYVLLHIPKGIAFGWGLCFVLFALAAAVLGRTFRRGERWGIRGLGDCLAAGAPPLRDDRGRARDAAHLRIHPPAGAPGRRLRPRGDPRARPRLTGRRGGSVPDSRRGEPVGSGSEPVHPVLALHAPSRRGASALCRGVRPVEPGSTAEIREMTRPRRAAGVGVTEQT